MREGELVGEELWQEETVPFVQPSEELRCSRNGRNWRCSRWRIHDKKQCELHFLRSKHNKKKKITLTQVEGDTVEEQEQTVLPILEEEFEDAASNAISAKRKKKKIVEDQAENATRKSTTVAEHATRKSTTVVDEAQHSTPIPISRKKSRTVEKEQAIPTSPKHAKRRKRTTVEDKEKQPVLEDGVEEE